MAKAMGKVIIIPILLHSLFLTSCSLLYKKPQFFNPHESGTEELSEEDAMGIGALDGGGSFKSNFSTGDLSDIHENVVFAPEDPNVAFSPVQGGVKSKALSTWTKDYKKAIQEAREEGKPLLIWFSNSRGSTTSALLSEELFANSEFNTWVAQNYSTLLVDKADTADVMEDKEIINQRKRYHKKITERFSVRGSPEVLVLDFNGEVFARYRGYTKGEANFYWGRLKVANQGAKLSYGIWREKMEKKSYRMWHSTDGFKKKFARLTKVEGENISLVTPEGKRFTQPLNSFSSLDRNWIAENPKE